MQSLTGTNFIMNNNNTNSDNNDLLKGQFDPTSANAAVAATMNFLQQQGRSSSTDPDIGTMDDVQFSASLDALLNGEQMSVAPSVVTTTTNNTNNNNTFPQQQQQQPTMNSSQQFLVSAPVNTILTNTGGGGGMPPLAPAPPPQQQQPQLAPQPAPTIAVVNQAGQLAGLPLASANQGVLQLVPPGPHSAAQMSLSAGHAAATGGFHPNAITTNNLPTNNNTLPQLPFPWALSGVPAPAPIISATAAASLTNNNNSTTTLPTHHNIKPAPTNKPPPLAAAPASRGGKRARVGAAGGGGGAMAAAAAASAGGGGGKDISAVSEDEGERERRRQDRNLREQQRSHRITEQIAQLRDVLSEANLQFKPDKYSTLTKVVEYIKQLQDRSKLLDAEHKKLVETISETNEIVNNQYVPAYTSGSDAPSVSNDVMGGDGSSSLEDESMVYVRGIDYKTCFKGCGVPMALASIDGRFLDCNDTFLHLTGYSREELLPLEEPGVQSKVSFSPDQDDSQKKNLSLFNLLSRDGMDQVFMAMSEMLKQPGSIGTAPKTMERLRDFWSGPVKLCRKNDFAARLNVTLVRTNRGRPKFFNCALTADSEEAGGGKKVADCCDDQTTITSPSQSPSDDSKETSTSGGEVRPAAELQLKEQGTQEEPMATEPATAPAPVEPTKNEDRG